MDGNGRWAKKHGAERLFGHNSALESVRNVVEGCAENQIEHLTLYAFSTENWNRPKQEIEGLMTLLIQAISEETPTLMKNNIRLGAIGDIKSLPFDCVNKLNECMQVTQNNSGLHLHLALSYSGRWDILEATKKIATKIKSGEIIEDEITESLFNSQLSTNNIPNPDLLIRTSGEMRISNFLLWEIAYTEIFVTPVLWPDFRKKDLMLAIEDYSKRERRFGKTSEQLNNI